ncbi:MULTISPECIES: APC family permease [Streptomyces]|uniref:APC family permease n=1 Tax=Streptomyces tsukubensis (strain DSM 42081 / NBRC 108919 / NRRL 18488 / 9993) TaxID=1114943 RepID=I2NBA3_STRT9|nr:MULTISPECIES: APC family permease [Streptomyces]AZK98035.1 amino acid transporter [Streptomyces tsukubensis]EIF94300.1 amino acid transporter [Streptomyces tsukubensis NRRL18488]MYS66169.1 amino acid permease [Streptomyces sp. SID5473]QKM66043.1 APC family permease [Streptomyces tsukubensis NRRL18488]TAI42323.1 APC family permease [Streptomyces tsukubensis]
MNPPPTALDPSPGAAAPASGATPPPQGTDGLAKGRIGTSDLVFFVVAAAAPLTVLAGVAPFAIGIGGPATPLGYLVSGILLVFFAAGFTAMSRHVRNAGAFYAYVARGLGRTLGVGTAYLATLSYNLIAPGVAAGFGYFASTTIEDLTGAEVPWWPLATLCVLGVGVLGWLRVTLSAKVLGIALVLEVLVLLVMEVGILADRGTEAFDTTSFDPSVLASSAGMAGMFVLVIGAFTGFEATAIYAEEARDPARTVPRATFIAIGFLALFYAFSVWVLMGGFGTDTSVSMARAADGPQLTFTAAEQFVGRWLADSMHVLIVISAFAATLAFHNAAARYLYALGREGLLPRRLARVSPKQGSPAAAVVVQTVFGLVIVVGGALIGADPYGEIFLWSNSTGVLGIMVMQALAALAVVFFFRRDRQGMSVWRVVVAPLVAFAGLAVLAVLAVVHFDLLTGRTGAVNTALLVPLPVVLAIGIAVAVRIRRLDPARFARLTEVDVERD